MERGSTDECSILEIVSSLANVVVEDLARESCITGLIVEHCGTPIGCASLAILEDQFRIRITPSP